MRPDGQVHPTEALTPSAISPWSSPPPLPSSHNPPLLGPPLQASAHHFSCENNSPCLNLPFSRKPCMTPKSVPTTLPSAPTD